MRHYRVEAIESGWDPKTQTRKQAYIVYWAETGWSLYGPIRGKSALSRKLHEMERKGWEKEQASDE